MPAKAPKALNKIGHGEKISAPHKHGINPPIVDPANTHTQINDLEYIKLFYNDYTS